MTVSLIMPPIVVLGEALMDCIVQPNGAFIPYAGGSPYNVARAIALQGGTAIFINPMSTDELGQQLAAKLLHDGVVLGMPPNNLPTSLAIVSQKEGQPSYQFYREGVADRAFTVNQVIDYLARFPQPGILHTGALALVPPESEKTLAILIAAKAAGWTISLDINLRPKLAHDKVEYCSAVMHCVAVADWIKASDEDLQILLDGEQAVLGNLNKADIVWHQAPAIASALASYGCQRIAITYGGAGAYLLMNGIATQIPAPAIIVADTVGAGDTFWATCLLDWARGNSIVTETLLKAIHAAAINCTRKGCNPPTAAELAAAVLLV